MFPNHRFVLWCCVHWNGWFCIFDGRDATGGLLKNYMWKLQGIILIFLSVCPSTGRY